MQDLFVFSGFPFEIIGIVVALLGFTGADKKVEAGLHVATTNWRNNTPWLGQHAKRYMPGYSNFKWHWHAWLICTAMFVAAYFVWLRHTSPLQKYVEAGLAFFAPWSGMEIGIAIVAGIIGSYVVWSLWTVVFAFMGYLLIAALWRVSWLLSRPPSGVLGSIGLLVALWGPVSQILG